MYDFLNYAPVLVGLLILVYISFRRQSGIKYLLWFIMTVFGIGLISSYLRTVMFLRDLGLAAHVPEEVFIAAVWATWMPTAIAFIVCLFIIGIANYIKTKKSDL